MARGRSSSPSRSAPPPRRAAPAPAPSRAASTTTRTAPPPAVRTPAPAPAPMQQQSGGGGMLSGIGSTIVQGMAFGTGSAIAHRAVGAVVGAVSGGGGADEGQAAPAPAVSAATNANSDPCQLDWNNFNKCLTENSGQINTCQFYYDVMKQCQLESANKRAY